MSEEATLDGLVTELEDAAVRLRSGALGGPAAAELVERCAELAARIGAELERAGREVERDGPAKGQEQLL